MAAPELPHQLDVIPSAGPLELGQLVDKCCVLQGMHLASVKLRFGYVDTS